MSNPDEQYKLALLKLVRELSDEDFEKLIVRFEAIHNAVATFFDLLNPILLFLGILPIDPQAKIEGLCESCARPCGERQEQTVECKNYCEFVPEKCPRCIYWDVRICTLSGICREGAEFESAEEYDLDEEPIDV